MSTNLSRRAFASGASLAAMAVPAGAACVLSGPFPTLAEVNASPDHELLVLEAQLNRILVERYIPRCKANNQEMLERQASAEQEYRDLEATGITLTERQRLVIWSDIFSARTRRNIECWPRSRMTSGMRSIPLLTTSATKSLT
jgi:hypothetical protein